MEAAGTVGVVHLALNSDQQGLITRWKTRLKAYIDPGLHISCAHFRIACPEFLKPNTGSQIQHKLVVCSSKCLLLLCISWLACGCAFSCFSCAAAGSQERHMRQSQLYSHFQADTQLCTPRLLCCVAKGNQECKLTPSGRQTCLHHSTNVLQGSSYADAKALLTALAVAMNNFITA